MFVKGFWSQFDSWTGWHLLAPYVLCDIVNMKFAILCVIIWETCDLLWCITYRFYSNNFIKLIDHVFDKRGVSWGDILVGLIGIAFHAFKHGGIVYQWGL